MGLSWNAALFLRACGLYSFLSAFFFPLCPAMVSFPHFTKVEAGSPQEAGEGLEFSRSHAGLQPSPRHGAQTLSRKGAYSCFLFSKTSLITSLSKLIHSLQSKKYNHHYHRQSSMHAFPFPPPCSELLISLLTDIPQALPAADCGTSMIPNPMWRHGGIRGSWLQLRLGQIFLGYRHFKWSLTLVWPQAPHLGWWKCRLGPELHVLGQLQCTGLCLRSGRQKLGLQKLGNQSKNMYFSKSLFSSCVFLPYTLEMLGKWFFVPRAAFSLEKNVPTNHIPM